MCIVLVMCCVLQVFVCCDAEDITKDFEKSTMNKVIDKYANTITLFVTVPPPPANPKLNPDGSLKHQTTPQATPTDSFQDNFVNNITEDSVSEDSVSETQRNQQTDANQERGVAAGGPEEGGVAAEEAGGAAGGVAAGGTEGDKVDDITGVRPAGERGVAPEGGVAPDGGVTPGTQSSEGTSEATEKTPTVNMEDTNRPLQRSGWSQWVWFLW